MYHVSACGDQKKVLDQSLSYVGLRVGSGN